MIFLDFEASGMTGFPIEVGFCVIDAQGEMRENLVTPEEERRARRPSCTGYATCWRPPALIPADFSDGGGGAECQLGPKRRR
jgi:hypothetical protein